MQIEVYNCKVTMCFIFCQAGLSFSLPFTYTVLSYQCSRVMLNLTHYFNIIRYVCVLRELCLISFHPNLNIKALPTQQISIRSVGGVVSGERTSKASFASFSVCSWLFLFFCSNGTFCGLLSDPSQFHEIISAKALINCFSLPV